jgi:hypothetical protein
MASGPGQMAVDTRASGKMMSNGTVLSTALADRKFGPTRTGQCCILKDNEVTNLS